MILYTTYQFRLKDGNLRLFLKKLAWETNLVWNYVNDIVRKRWKESRLYTSEADLNKLLKGSSEFLSINAQSIQAITQEYLLKLKTVKKFLRWRSVKKHLGWLPFKGQSFKFHGGYAVYNKQKFRLWQHRALPEGAAIKMGSFGEDARGRWYLNLVVEAPKLSPEENPPPGSFVGIDPGLKTIITTSDGDMFERSNLTKTYAAKLAKAQRRKKKKQVKNIHAKIKNSRKDFAHKVSLELAQSYETIFFGDVSSKKLAKTKMAKSVYDAAWQQIKEFCRYKSLRRGGKLLEISERKSTITCSSCLEETGPSGLSGLGVRGWTCRGCNTVHDRDVNAAKNILRFGHETLRALASDCRHQTKRKGSPRYNHKV